jgi:hypothetical protein
MEFGRSVIVARKWGWLNDSTDFDSVPLAERSGGLSTMFGKMLVLIIVKISVLTLAKPSDQREIDLPLIQARHPKCETISEFRTLIESRRLFTVLCPLGVRP